MAVNRRCCVYADLVLNHMANEARDDRFDFPGRAELERYRRQPDVYEENRLYGDLGTGLFTALDFNHAGEIEGGEWADREAVQLQNLSGLPDLRDSAWVLEQQHLLVDAMVAMGFDGFRVDAIKHITERMIDNIADRPEVRNKFWFGEVLAGSDHDERVFLAPFLRETWMSAYDFPLFATIREAFGPGGSLRALMNPANDGNALPWDRAVTFVVNHDIPHNEVFRPWLLDRQDEHLAHAFILGATAGCRWSIPTTTSHPTRRIATGGSTPGSGRTWRPWSASTTRCTALRWTCSTPATRCWSSGAGSGASWPSTRPASASGRSSAPGDWGIPAPTGNSSTGM
jgi:alpha-amylase